MVCVAPLSKIKPVERPLANLLTVKENGTLKKKLISQGLKKEKNSLTNNFLLIKNVHSNCIR